MPSPSKDTVKVSDATSADDGKKPSWGHLPFWTPGSRHYGKTHGQTLKPIVDAASEFILDSIGELIVKADGVFTIGDYGTNDGSTSMDLMTKVVGQIRKTHGNELPVQIIYEDQEENDFDSLFATLADKNSVTSKFTEVYALATNVNFYKQCVPDSTCDVIFTSFATHWKENSDATFKDAIYQQSPRASQDERQRFLLAAAQDWVKFLLLRAKELKPGGLLVDLSVSQSDDFQPFSGDSIADSDEASAKNDCPGSRVGSTCDEVHSDLEAVWLQLADEKIIESEECESCTINFVFRSSKDFAAPFQAEESPVVKAGLSIVYHDQVVLKNQLKFLWQEKCKEGVDDRDSFAQDLMESVRVFSHSSFESSLSSSRSDQQKEAIIDELYDRFRKRVASKNPATYNCDYILSRLVVKN